MYIITGGGSGIGKALAHQLAQSGKSVLIVGRREQPLQETADLYTSIEYLCADVSSDEGQHAIVEKLKACKRIQALVHNAGVIEPVMPVSDIGSVDWRQVMATNLEAPLFLTQKLYTKLAHGRVLNIGSGAAYFPVAGWSAYCVSKAALAMLTRCWQLESKDVAFASVMPGIIDTDMQALIRQSSHMEHDKQAFFQQMKEANQLLNPKTVALFLSWLLLDLDSHTFQSKEWDIYEASHHESWLKPPHVVPALD